MNGSIAIAKAVQAEYLFAKRKEEKKRRAENFKAILFYLDKRNESKFLKK